MGGGNQGSAPAPYCDPGARALGGRPPILRAGCFKILKSKRAYQLVAAWSLARKHNGVDRTLILWFDLESKAVFGPPAVPCPPPEKRSVR